MLNIYRASAGSGKTYRLTQDYIQLLFKSKNERVHRKILAVTFTNKATEEMKSRILKELHSLAKGEKSDYRQGLCDANTMSEQAVNERAKKILTTILHDYSSFSISTIDKFFQQVIRSFARDIGVHGGYNLELDNTSTLEQSVDNMFMDLSKPENIQLLQWLTQFAEERIEQSENWNMRSSIISLGTQIFNENYQHKAEATNIKINEKEFLGNYKKKLRSLKTNFENKLKDDAKKALALIDSKGLTLDQFKGGSRSPIKTLEKLQNGIIDIKPSFLSLAECVENCYVKKTSKDIIATIEDVYATGLQDLLLKIINLVQSEMSIYNSANLVLKHINSIGILSDLTLQIKKLTQEQNTMLITDSNLMLNKIIDNSETPFVYEKTGIQIDNFMIDEFQDTSTLQWQNFHPLLSNSLADGKLNLVVGDVKQSIYRWRNSDWKLLDEKILTDFRPEQLNEENLDTNWRSDKNIIDFNNAFFLKAAETLQDKLNTDLKEVIPTHPELKALTHKIEHAYANIHQKTSPKAGTGKVKISFIDQSENEDGWKTVSLNQLPNLIEEIQDQGYSPSDIAFLVRTKDEEQLVIKKMLNFKTTTVAKNKYCYDVMGNQGLLIGSSASVRFILGILQLYVNPNDSIQKTIVSYEYARGKQKKSESEALNSCFEQSTNTSTQFSPLFSVEDNNRLIQLQHTSLFQMVEQIISLFNIGNWNNEAVFVQAFQDLVFKFTNNKTADLNSFLNWWKKNGEKQSISTPDSQNAMRIMTVHKSKGLDFKVVIMPFCDWDLDSSKSNILWCEPNVAPFNELPLLPIEYGSKVSNSIFAVNYFDEQMHQYIDNLNVAYVAFTRAKHELICFAPCPKKDVDSLEIKTLSTLLYSTFENPTPSQSLQIIPLSDFYNPETKVFEIGEATKDTSTKQKIQVDIKINTYPTVNSLSRLRIRHQSADYLTDNKNITDSSLNYGIVMHDILKQINRKSDQESAIQELVNSGRINEEDKLRIIEDLEKFWSLPQTNDWFNNDSKILNETTILTPHGQHYRPDRVVINDNNAIIIDYKFGDKENPQYNMQVKEYMTLIEKMGYHTTGFVCYVILRKVEKV